MGAERRREVRQAISRPCKILDLGAARFSDGRTIDASKGGARIQVRGLRALRVGDRVGLGIDWREAGVLTTDELVPARVVRVESDASGCIAAVALER